MRRVCVMLHICRDESFSLLVDDDNEKAAQQIREHIVKEQFGANNDGEYHKITVLDNNLRTDITADIQP